MSHIVGTPNPKAKTAKCETAAQKKRNGKAKTQKRAA